MTDGRCPRCATTLAPEARFCPTCGSARPTPDSDSPTLLSDRPTELSPPASGSSAATRLGSSAEGWLTASGGIDHGRFQPGEVVDGRYRVIGLIGRGGMGEVYRADDLRLGQPVALKFLPESLGRDPLRLAQFHNEVRTARQVSHPNVCRVHDIGEVGGLIYLSMEYVDGEDLETSLRRIGRFAEDRALEIARQICSGVAAAHERGVLHRDLKPANIMLDAGGRVRLMDFGLAAVGEVADIRTGTPAYMAPEQLQGREVTQRSDIFALGLVLFEIFTGRRVFQAATIAELVTLHESGPTSTPTDVIKDLDPAIERAILRCLAPDPSKRPSSALAVAAALPGGDPLGAALAAGQTLSPDEVAAAGAAAVTHRRLLVPLFVFVIAGIAAAVVLAVRMSPLQWIQPEFTPEVLAQKARDFLASIGGERAADEAYGLDWNQVLVGHIQRTEDPAPNWHSALAASPSPLQFWYRRSAAPMTGLMFHGDRLTPGIVGPTDPPPIRERMATVVLDHRGNLLYFEAIPLQQDPDAGRGESGSVDWTPLMRAAGLDAAVLQPSRPEWNWLAGSDTRVAWIGTWPGSSRPLRVEAAALHGRPVAFQAGGPWTTGWRRETPTVAQEMVLLGVVFLFVVPALVGSAWLAHRNLRAGRGDQPGAAMLGIVTTTMLLLLWACSVHVVASSGFLATLLVAICTSVFYGVAFWAIYLALEPFVRRHWPQMLVSWTTVLRGRLRERVVGSDVLVGIALGVVIALLVRIVLLASDASPSSAVGSLDPLLGLRSTAGVVVDYAITAIRSALVFVLLLSAFRVILRKPWLAATAFVALFSFMEMLDGDDALVEGFLAFINFSLFAFAAVRIGLTAVVLAIFVANLLLNVPATFDLSAWFVGSAAVVIAVPIALAIWALTVALGRPRASGVRAA